MQIYSVAVIAKIFESMSESGQTKNLVIVNV